MPPSSDPGANVKAAERSGRSEVEAGGTGAPAPGEERTRPAGAAGLDCSEGAQRALT
jgi:hypothetical protein